MSTMTLAPGTVVEWWINKNDGRQESRVVLPTCANSGQMEHAGQCRCAPSPEEWARAQAEDAKAFFFRADEGDESMKFWFTVAEQLAQLFVAGN